MRVARLVPFCFCALAVLSVMVVSGGAAGQAQQKPAQPATLDGAVSAYFGGDTEVVDRTFARPRDFQDRHLDDVRELERWLGPFDQRKAVVLLEMARAAARVAPRYAPVLIKAGGGYLGRIPAEERKLPPVEAFLQAWHRIAVGLLEGADDPAAVEAHVDDAVTRSARGSSPGPDARLVLARAVAQERRCWDDRPALDQVSDSLDAIARAAGMPVTDAPGPAKAVREAKGPAYAACLREALTRLDTAAGLEETRAEARVRSGWILFQQTRLPEALAALETTPGIDSGNPFPESSDRELAYWRALFRGRVLTALGRAEDAESAYRAALVLFPSAQSAGIGQTLVLVRLDRVTDADTAARALRTSAVVAADPWSIYGDADRRFVDRWIGQLRESVR